MTFGVRSSLHDRRVVLKLHLPSCRSNERRDVVRIFCPRIEYIVDAERSETSRSKYEEMEEANRSLTGTAGYAPERYCTSSTRRDIVWM